MCSSRRRTGSTETDAEHQEDLGQGQVPDIAKTDEIPKAQCRGDARQTVVQIQCPTPRRSSAVQYENEVVDMPVV